MSDSADIARFKHQLGAMRDDLRDSRKAADEIQ